MVDRKVILGRINKLHRIKMKTQHPRRKPNGEIVWIEVPTKPSQLHTWSSSDTIATATPDCELPESVNGIEFRPTRGAITSEIVETTLYEPLPSDEVTAAGAIVVESDNRVWLVSPTNQFANYTNTFPKGKCGGLGLHEAAIKEVLEETGLEIELDGFVADSVRTRSTTRFYLAHRVGGTPKSMDWESQAVHLVPISLLETFLNRSEDLALIEPLEMALSNYLKK